MPTLMPRVRVDFNTRDRDGLLRVRRDRLGSLSIGDDVEAYDPEDGSRAIGRVERFNESGTLGYVRVNFDDVMDESTLANIDFGGAAFGVFQVAKVGFTAHHTTVDRSQTLAEA